MDGWILIYNNNNNKSEGDGGSGGYSQLNIQKYFTRWNGFREKSYINIEG